MGMQETAEDVLGLVQALAQGKQVESRRKFKDAIWRPMQDEKYELYFNLSDFEYRIKTDPLEAWRKELLDYVIDYGRQTEKAAHCFVRNNQREGANHEAQAEAALNAFKSKLAFGPKGFQ